MLNAECVEYINLWLSKRGFESEYIFALNKSGIIRQIGRSWADDLSTDVLSDILGRRINPHLFKASAVTYLLEQGKDIKTVSKFIAQHNDVSTTQNFYDLRPDEGMDDLFS